MNVFELFAKIGLDTTSYDKGLEGAEKSTKSFGTNLKKGLAVAAGVTTAAITATAAAAGVAGKAFLNAANDVATYGDDVDKNSQKLGISAKAYQQWDFILQHSGSSIDGLKKGLTTLSTAMGELQDASTKTIDTTQINKTKLAYDKATLSVKDAQKAYKNAVKEHGKNSSEAQKAAIKVKEAQLKASEAQNAYAVACEGSAPKISNAASAVQSLGIKTTDATGKLRAQEDVFSDVVKALQGIENESDRTAKAVAIFGKAAAADLGPLLNTSADDTEAMKKQIIDLGGVMSDKAVKDAAAYKDSLQNMSTAFDGLKRNMIGEFLPSLTAVTDGLAKVFSGDESGIGNVKSGLQSLVDNLTKMAPKFFNLAGQIINSLISGFGPMLPQLVSTIFQVITQAITTVSGMVPQLMPSIISGIEGAMKALITALPIVINGVTQLIMALVNWLSSEDNVKTLVNAIVTMVTEMVNSFGMILPVLLPAVVTIIGEVAKALTEPDNVEMLLKAILTVIGAIAVAIVKSLPILIDAVKNIFKNLGNLMADFLGAGADLVADGIGVIVKTVKSWGNSVKTFITNLINGIKTGITNWINNLKQAFTDGFNAIKDKVSTILSNIGSFVGSVIDKIKELPSKVVSIGKDLVEGLWKGISNKIDWVKDKIKSMGEGITKAIKKVFGVASPSKVFMSVGNFLAEGLGIGYEQGMKDVQKNILGISENLTDSIIAKTPNFTTAGASNASKTIYGGNITMNIYATEGQDIRELAKEVSRELQNLVTDKEKAYA